MDNGDITLASCLLPVFVATLVSWLLIHKKHALIGIIAGSFTILLLVVLFYFFIIIRGWGLDKHGTDPLYDVAIEVDAILIGFAIFMGVIDSLIVFCINVPLAIIYRRIYQRRKTS